MHRTLLAISGALVGATIGYARHRRRQAERLAAATLETLLNAIDANDALTGAHVRRVAAYGLILAEAVGIDEHGRKDVERVALFHDIGKLHAALFDIIHEHSKLTPEERRAVTTHPKRGAEVLAPLSAFYPSLSAGVIAHHERWDGGGYPNGLRGLDIPLTSRVVAIVDTFDAITASRRYHRGEDIAKALDVIRDGRGTQFDPELTDRFLSAPVMKAITEALGQSRAESRAPRRRNRRHMSERGAPDVSFRWRDRIAVPKANADKST